MRLAGSYLKNFSNACRLVSEFAIRYQDTCRYEGLSKINSRRNNH
jgi:hypothetical protein